MKRPQPKELVIEYTPPTRSMIITAMSTDAQAWVAREAREFGRLLSIQDERVSLLYVNAAYDAAEVAAWLASYNQDGGE